MLTLTLAYDPRDPAQVTPNAIEARSRVLWQSWRTLWRSWLGVRGAAAALVSEEVASSGHVHLHVGYCGGFVHVRELARRHTAAVLEQSPVTPARAAVLANQRAAAESAPLHCFVSASQGTDLPLELIKYLCKSPTVTGRSGEAWIAGQRRDTLHPKLCAAIERAAFGRRQIERYGAFRRLALADDEESEGESIEVHAIERADHETPCAHCGSVGDWKWSAEGSPRLWVLRCRAAGARAFAQVERADHKTGPPE